MERKKVTKNIGILNNDVLVFGGVYSNLQALEKMMQIADDLKIPPSQIICTGDVVGYCAQPEACVQKMIDWGIHAIAGNVEIQLREGEEDCGCDFSEGSRCDTFSRQWYPFAKTQLSIASIDWMVALPDFIEFNYATKKGLVVHGSYFETAAYLFKSSTWKIKEKNFTATNTDFILAGHCGLPFNDYKKGKYWLNPGVIGMPANDGTTRVWYMILKKSYDGDLCFEHKNFDYNFEKASKLMEANHLPSEYASTLKTGIWDNCEILPKVETEAQGKILLL